MKNKTFDTNVFFSGGAGMFLQYHDIVKPVYLYAIYKMMITGESFGLPINILKTMSVFSLVEWYINRRYINPFKCLDYNNYLDDKQLDGMLMGYLLHDKSLYNISPALNIQRMLKVYNSQHMTFPIYVYSKIEEPSILEDCNNIFNGIKVRYIYGDLKEAISKCDQNFTYIFSDIELMKNAAEILNGTCSHILLASDYRYNYIGNREKLKYDIKELAQMHPFIRTGTTQAVDIVELAASFKKIKEIIKQEV